ncbi:hypothetical protein [Roseateles sp.]|uniref:hypothetical protein n=1 Tax=Roseateles sp. TaxID=1971397 RepID=UPI0026004B44|nr:hypothetical protein [Roseateles sp.]MBV8036411.1 hypothetical protein [Roseateles sp.]
MQTRIDISGTDHEVASWIWNHLVPEQGQAGSIQGEMLRAVEKLRWEAQENGNINWDEGFLILLGFLEEHLAGHQGFSAAERQAIRNDLARLRDFLPADELADGADDSALPCTEDELYDRLEGFVVAFARTQPQPLPRAHDPRLQR